MIVAVDIGNSNIVFAIFENEECKYTWRLYTDQKKTTDEYYVIFSSLIEKANIDISKVEKVIISSVVPFLNRALEKNMYLLFKRTPLHVTRDIESGLVKSSIPLELGSDLLSNAAYAHYKYPDKNVTVVDFGTALTLTTVNTKGEILGVTIAPGLVTAVNSLFGSTAQLPQVELKIPKTVLGRDSQSSIRSGIMFGWASMVDNMISLIEKEIKEDVFVIGTGGLSATISPLIKRFDYIDMLHTLKGLALIASLN